MRNWKIVLVTLAAFVIILFLGFGISITSYLHGCTGGC
jgi:hypothetical protein